jgi:hypothetical protein
MKKTWVGNERKNKEAGIKAKKKLMTTIIEF